MIFVLLTVQFSERLGRECWTEVAAIASMPTWASVKASMRYTSAPELS